MPSCLHRSVVATRQKSTCQTDLVQYVACYRYLVALDPTLPEAEMPPLPVLPQNAEFVIPPACFEMGVVGWLVHKSGIVNVKNYKCGLSALPWSNYAAEQLVGAMAKGFRR